MSHYHNNVVTRENYRWIYSWIRKKQVTYRINLENWVMTKFRELPIAPDDGAVLNLNQWIRAYLPSALSRAMWNQLDNTKKP